MRHDKRRPQQTRPIKLIRSYTQGAPGSVFVQAGRTTLLVTASVEESVPPWMRGKGKGWLTAEYAMLPGSTRPRKNRDRAGKLDGRTVEIQRLIGRSLRAAVDLAKLGERTVTVDCDVLEADGGTRTTAITAGFVALVDAVKSLSLPNGGRDVFVRSVAAVSVGLIGQQVVADLDYKEDSTATVDMNVVMAGTGEFIEVQGTGEGGVFTSRQLQAMLKVATPAIEALTELQQTTLGTDWPFQPAKRARTRR
jgi:ribonuclease PH